MKHIQRIPSSDQYLLVPSTTMDAPSRLWNRLKSRVTAYYRSLTRDFNYRTDFFFGFDFMMVAMGARLDPGVSDRIRRCWNLYRWVIYLPVLVAFWNSALNIYRRERLEIILSCLQMVIACGVTFLRMFVILRHYEPLMEVRRYLNAQEVGRNLGPSLGIRSRAFYHIRRIVIFSMIIMVCVIGSILAQDISKHHYFKLPFELTSSIAQRICEDIVYIVGFGVTMMIILVFMIIYIVVTGLTAEMKILAEMFAVTFENATKKANLNFCKHVQQELKRCVECHCEFLAVLDKIKPLLNTSFLIVYYSTVLSLASGTIYLSQTKDVTIFSLQTLFYCVWAALECGSLTRMVSLLTEASESIGWTVYALDWPTALEWEPRFQLQYRAVRQTMLNVMAVARQPLRLNCFGFFEFTQDRFYELLNMAYSLFMFFRGFF